MKSRLYHHLARAACVGVLGLASATVLAGEQQGPQQPWSKYKVADMTRPVAPVVSPGTCSTQEEPGKPPSDAIVLFDGKSLDKWELKDGSGPSPWKLEDGAMVADKDYIRSKQKFGDIQLHIEWQEPNPPKGEGQGRGNSGVFLMGLFEVQVLDSYHNTTYADGQCGAIYSQYPPQVNACRPPGEWQSYDIIFHRPRYKDDQLVKPAYLTVFQNGVLIQDHQRVEGPTGYMTVGKYTKRVPDKDSIYLQYHGDPMHFRNIWVRPLEALSIQQHTGKLASEAEAGQK